MNLKQLQYFLKLAETEHYRKSGRSPVHYRTEFEPGYPGYGGKRAGHPAFL